MPSKLDPDARTGDKLLRLFRKLLFDNRLRNVMITYWAKTR